MEHWSNPIYIPQSMQRISQAAAVLSCRDTPTVGEAPNLLDSHLCIIMRCRDGQEATTNLKICRGFWEFSMIMHHDVRSEHGTWEPAPKLSYIIKSRRSRCLKCTGESCLTFNPRLKLAAKVNIRIYSSTSPMTNNGSALGQWISKRCA